MKAEDIYNVTGLREMKMEGKMNLYNTKYCKLFANGTSGYYWLASENGSDYLWRVNGSGSAYGGNGEYRHPPCSFSKTKY